MTDATGAPPPPPPPPPLSEQPFANDFPAPATLEVRDTVAPKLDRVKVTRARKGAKVRLRLSEAGKVAVKLARGKAVKRRTVEVAKGTSTLTVSGLRAGTYRVQVTATDLAGNAAGAPRAHPRHRPLEATKEGPLARALSRASLDAADYGVVVVRTNRSVLRTAPDGQHVGGLDDLAELHGRRGAGDRGGPGRHGPRSGVALLTLASVPLACITCRSRGMTDVPLHQAAVVGVRRGRRPTAWRWPRGGHRRGRRPGVRLGHARDERAERRAGRPRATRMLGTIATDLGRRPSVGRLIVNVDRLDRPRRCRRGRPPRYSTDVVALLG